MTHEIELCIQKAMSLSKTANEIVCELLKLAENPAIKEDHTDRVLTGRAPPNLREILEDSVKEERSGLELIGMSYMNGLATGYFIYPSGPAYVHIWQIMIAPDDYVIYSSTLREIAIVPIDGFRLRFDIVFTKRTDELRKLGFYIPEKDGVLYERHKKR
jgi:hypothetical protein